MMPNAIGRVHHQEASTALTRADIFISDGSIRLVVAHDSLLSASDPAPPCAKTFTAGPDQPLFVNTAQSSLKLMTGTRSKLSTFGQPPSETGDTQIPHPLQCNKQASTPQVFTLFLDAGNMGSGSPCNPPTAIVNAMANAAAAPPAVCPRHPSEDLVQFGSVL